MTTTNDSSLRTIHVALGARSYPVWIGPSLLSDHTRWRTALRGRHALVVSNTTVAPLYLDRVAEGLDGLHWASFLLDDGEAHKTFANVGRALEALAQLGATRDACVVALGGGVVGDLAGFSADASVVTERIGTIFACDLNPASATGLGWDCSAAWRRLGAPGI